MIKQEFKEEFLQRIESKEEFLQRIKREYDEDEIKEFTHNYNDVYVDFLYGIYLTVYATGISIQALMEIKESIHNDPIKLNSLQELKESIEKQYDRKNIEIL